MLPYPQVLTSEQDLSTKRNAFLMLCQHDQNRAIQYLLLGQLDSVAMWGDILQMAVLELIRKASDSLLNAAAFMSGQCENQSHAFSFHQPLQLAIEEAFPSTKNSNKKGLYLPCLRRRSLLHCLDFRPSMVFL